MKYKNRLKKLEARIKFYEAIKNKVKEHALNAGTKTAAKHYLELADERQAFDSEIEKLTK